jgi:hypothetical protein
MTEEATTQVPPAEPSAPQWTPEVEEQARAWGWKSPDEWKGELPPTYIDNPERYVERAKSYLPVRKIEEELIAVKNSVDERVRKVETVLSRAHERERAALVAQIEQIKAEKVAAVEVGDVDRFKALEKREDALRKDAEAPQEQQRQPEVPQEHRTAIDTWRVDKPWFQTDAIKTQAAVIYYGEAEAKGIREPQAILRYVDMQMAKQFRDIGEQVVAKSQVEAGLTFGGGSTASAYDKLPADAKEAFKRFAAKGIFPDTKEGRAAYAEDYNAA